MRWLKRRTVEKTWACDDKAKQRRATMEGGGGGDGGGKIGCYGFERLEFFLGCFEEGDDK